MTLEELNIAQKPHSNRTSFLGECKNVLYDLNLAHKTSVKIPGQYCFLALTVINLTSPECVNG